MSIELIKLIVKNDVSSLAEKCHEKKILQKNCLNSSHVRKVLSRGKLLFLFVNVSLDEVLAELTALRQEQAIKIKELENKNDQQARTLEELKNEQEELKREEAIQREELRKMKMALDELNQKMRKNQKEESESTANK